jgi:Periplasmic copper-binding protein (NosD)
VVERRARRVRCVGHIVRRVTLFLTAAAAALLHPSLGSADDDSERSRHRHVDCADGETITGVLPSLHPGDTVFIRGACHENLLIGSAVGQFNGVTLDGQGTASIHGSDPTLNTIELTGVSSFTVRGLTVSGGNDGLSINTASQTTVDRVTVQNAGRHGIHFQRGSAMGYIVNSTIRNNPGNGVVVNENSYVRVGFTAGMGASQDAVGPCSIIGNGGFGVRVQRASSARIYASTISRNGNEGVNVESESYAEIATNIIDENGKSGVAVSENSTVHLGNPTGTRNEDNPNSSSIPNGQFGLSASSGSYVQGRLGSLSGVSGASSFTRAAINNLSP